MEMKNKLKVNSPYIGNGSLTREQFLFHEMRTTARLICEGLFREDIVDRVVRENLFQYPTEKSVRGMVKTCLFRLGCLKDDSLVVAIANQSSAEAKQICLYAMMKQYRLVWDFMITVVGEKYRVFDMTFGNRDLNEYFMRLQEQDDVVAKWSDLTIGKLKQVLRKLLIENEYLDNSKSERLNPVLICHILENSIRQNGDERALIAFNCFL